MNLGKSMITFAGTRTKIWSEISKHIKILQKHQFEKECKKTFTQFIQPIFFSCVYVFFFCLLLFVYFLMLLLLLWFYYVYILYLYEVCLKSIGTVCFAQTTLATVIKALFFKMAQCLVVVKM